MKSLRSQRETLLELTIASAARSGLDGISLRAIAAEAGASTTAIFQNYAGKAELIADAVRAAIARDDDFHRALRDQAFGLVRGHLGFADFIVAYIEQRTDHAPARFLSEVLVQVQNHPQCVDALRDWHNGRHAFWADLTALQNAPAGFSTIVGDYVLMEEYYAYALMQQVQYRLLLQETARALCQAVFDDGDARPSNGAVSLELNVAPLSVHVPTAHGDHLVAGQLLDAAVQIINRNGVGGINQRAIARAVGVSPSMLAYHFDDMKTFTTQAIWHALVQRIPVQLDPDHNDEQMPRDLSQWIAILGGLLTIDPQDPDPGFYIGFSRLTGEASLMALRDPGLLPLIVYLRGLEGWGTYRVSRSIAPLAPAIGRDHAAAFGVWLKAEAMLRNAGLVDGMGGTDRLTKAAGMIFPSPVSRPDQQAAVSGSDG